MSGIHDFQLYQRVQSHPATDFWMRGLRYGIVTKIGRKLVHVKFDNQIASSRAKKLSPGNLIIIEERVGI